MKNRDFSDKKIAVIGIGGVGGYLAGMLAKAYPHVTLVARGERRRSIEENGLVVHSDYHGEIKVRPEKVVESSQELGKQDYIFICVKNYSLEEVCRELVDVVTDETVIIPVMNGVGPGERTREYLGCGTVIDSLIYIVAFANADYSITQQDTYAYLRIGIMNADERQLVKVKETGELLAGADIDCKETEDIEREIWRKYMLNCAYNVESAFYGNTIGELRRDPVKAKEYEDLVKESYQVASAKGVHVTQEHVDEIIHRFYYEIAEDATSSLQRDIQEGRMTELDIFGGYLIGEAHKYNLKIPVSRRMYEGLKEKIQR